MVFLPGALAATTDAQNALDRCVSFLSLLNTSHAPSLIHSLIKVFQAPLSEGDSFTIDPSQKLALEVRDATFEWEETLSAKQAKEARAKGKKGKGIAKDTSAEVKDVHEDPPFQVRNIDMLVPRGSLVAIVGAVGSGKVRASLLPRDIVADAKSRFIV